MKPKTKIQKRVVELSKSLPPLTEAQQKWAKEMIFKPTGYLRTKSVWCHECGENFIPGSSYLATSLCGVECPNCGKELSIINSKRRSVSGSWYYSVFTTKGGFQVIRHFIVDKVCKTGYPAQISINEVVQNWISPEGNIIHLARSTSMSIYYDLWDYGSPLEVRSKPSIKEKYEINSKYIYPQKGITSKLRRNGFQGGLHNIPPCDLLPALLKNPRIETLLKSKQYSLLKLFSNRYNYSMIDKYWPSIKICMRNNYTVKDASSWCDYIDLLVHFGKDIRNAHFVCPDDFNEAHDRYVEKKRIERERLAKEEKIKRAAEEEEAYKVFIQRFLGLSISDGEILIEPLKSVSEFIQEGDELHHCVFTNEYFNREDTLILSAKISGQRVETIQFDLKNMDVVQSRGLFNKNTLYHEKILKIVDQNKHLILQCKRRELNVEHSSKAV